MHAADPRAAVRSVFQTDVLDAGEAKRAGRLRVVGAGKAAHEMTLGLLDVFDEQIEQGLIISKHVMDGLPERIRELAGDHPVPGPLSVESTHALVDFLRAGKPGDLLFCLISGGGSSLMTYPVEGVGLEDLQDMTRLLLASGASIQEINTLRKHLDRVKGGNLAKLASPARVASLVLSDVIGSPLDAIASGPTAADPTTYADGAAVLKKYALLESISAAVRTVFEEGVEGRRPETLKPGDPLLKDVTNTLIASNLQAAQAALEQAQAEGFNALLLTSYLQGEASQAGLVLASILKQIDQTGQPTARPACIIAGGETTVTLRGAGRGGRNQEVALGAVKLLDDVPNVALLALGTDGEDGPTDAAGALVTGQTFAQAQALGLDPALALRENNTYDFFSRLGQLVITGPTGTNVNDLTFLFAF